MNENEKKILGFKRLYRDMKDNADVVECVCGNTVSLTWENELFNERFTCVICGNLVACRFDNKVWDSAKFLDINNNPEIKARGKPLGYENFHISPLKTKKEKYIAKLLTWTVEDDDSFLTPSDEMEVEIIWNDKEIIGFIIWTRLETAILNAIFIKKEYRRKGIGSRFLKFWVENISDKISDEFLVESPNEKTQNMLVKLGYARREGDIPIGMKCGFSRSL